jgi:GDP/UDP-N,N'-diacetylbacillosamine 2-epimerase (hydrolysing)
LILTLPNADTDGRVVIGMIQDFVARRCNAFAFTSLGQLRYLSCLKQVDGMVGNSSSGLLEMPTFCKGTVNIGDRQRGRMRAASVIDCAAERGAIGQAISRLYETGFQAQLPLVVNPYGQGGASEKVVRTLASVDLAGILKKRFHDLPRP